MKMKIKIDEAFVFFVGTFFRRNSNEKKGDIFDTNIFTRFFA
jgi:hypothetical protein